MILSNQLRSQHARIRLMLSELETILDATAFGLDPAELHLKVCHLMRWVRVHLEYEQAELFPALLQRIGRAELGHCWSVGEQIAEIVPIVISYEARFRSQREIMLAGQEFVESTQAMSKLLRERIDREERWVCPLTDRVAALDRQQVKAARRARQDN